VAHPASADSNDAAMNQHVQWFGQDINTNLRTEVSALRAELSALRAELSALQEGRTGTAATAAPTTEATDFATLKSA
jgi:polyhydroxyalkanoate synthesis regulator phasin